MGWVVKCFCEGGKGGLGKRSGVKVSARWWGEGGKGRSYLNLWGPGTQRRLPVSPRPLFKCAYRRTLAKHTEMEGTTDAHRRPQRALSRPQVHSKPTNLEVDDESIAQALCRPPTSLSVAWTQCLGHRAVTACLCFIINFHIRPIGYSPEVPLTAKAETL
jgi:hypothetical protein